MSEFKFNKKLITSIIFFLMLTSGFIGFFNFSEILNFYNVEAMTIIVDQNNNGDYNTIQSAINAAKPGDTIHVRAGIYYENLIVNKTITIIGNSTQNTQVKGMKDDIGFYINSNWVNISGLTITGNNIGIKLNNSINCKIENNNCFNNDYGIYLWYSESNMVNDNDCINNAEGIFLRYSNSNIIKNNTCEFNNIYGIYVWNSNTNIITNNKFSNNTDINSDVLNSGMSISNSISNIIKNNICLNNDCGILLQESTSKNKIENNLCKFNDYGIRLGSQDESSRTSHDEYYVNNENYYNFDIYHPHLNTIINNSCLNNSVGIVLDLSAANTIINNNCSDNRYGIGLLESEENIIKNNICIKNNGGINLKESNHNSIYKNFISYNSQIGISIEFGNGYPSFISINNSIFKNIFSYNYNIGIMIECGCKNNYVFYNNIIFNKIQAIDNGTNFWHNSYRQGNFWSDYKGEDNGANNRTAEDGIGDTEIPQLGLDYFPLMRPVKLSHLPWEPILKNLHDLDSDGNYLLAWYESYNASGYILQEDNKITFESPLNIYNGSDLEYEIRQKDNGTFYYRVKAYNEFDESGWSNIVDIIVDWSPDIPKDFKVSADPRGNTLKLSWGLNSIDTEEYCIWTKNDSMDNWEPLINISHPHHTYNHTNLIDGRTYFYRIRAKDAIGQVSNFSTVISGTPMDIQPPAPPTGPTIISTTNDSISLVWKPNTEEDLEGYYIYRSESKIPEQWSEPIEKTSKNSEKYIDYNLKESTTYYYVITGFDEVPNESGYSKIIIGTTLIGPRAPEVNNSINNLEMAENTYDNSINLSSWFKDQNNDSLYFWCEGNENISVNINQKNGTVILKPKKNWFGKETLTFYASDGIFEKSFNITIIVVQINDPPGPIIITEPADNLKIEYQTLINFSASCSDADLPYGDKLTFTWSSNISGEFGIGYNLSNIILPPGHHKITLTVTDSGNLSSFRSINITVLPMKDINGLQMDDNNSDTQVTISRNINSNNILFPSVILLIIIVVLMIIFVSNRKFHTLEKKEIDRNGNDYSKIKQVKRKIYCFKNMKV